MLWLENLEFYFDLADSTYIYCIVGPGFPSEGTRMLPLAGSDPCGHGLFAGHRGQLEQAII